MTDTEVRAEIARLVGLLTDPHSIDVMVRTARWLLEAEEAEKHKPETPAPRIHWFDPHDTL